MAPLINGTAYSWSQIELRILNQVVAGITSIEYKDDEEMEDNYGQGSYPVSRSYGKYKADGKIGLEMAEVEALQMIAPLGRIQKIPEFDIIITYLPDGGKIVTHTLHNCRFKNNGRNTKAGEAGGINVEIDLMVSHISWKK